MAQLEGWLNWKVGLIRRLARLEGWLNWQLSAQSQRQTLTIKLHSKQIGTGQLLFLPPQQCIANIRISNYIQISFNKYSPSLKYLFVLGQQIYKDIHSLIKKYYIQNIQKILKPYLFVKQLR